MVDLDIASIDIAAVRIYLPHRLEHLSLASRVRPPRAARRD